MKLIISVMSKKDIYLYLLSFLFVLISATSDLLGPYIFSLVLNNINANRVSAKFDSSIIQWDLFGYMILVAFISIIFIVLAIFIAIPISIKITSRIRIKLFNHIQFLSSDLIDKYSKSTLVNILNNDIFQIQNFLFGSYITVIRSPCLIIGGIVLSFYQLASYVISGGQNEVWYSLVCYLLIFILMVWLIYLIKKTNPNFVEVKKSVDRTNEIMNENVVGNKLVRSFNLQNYEKQIYSKENLNLKNKNFKVEKIMIILEPSVLAVSNIATVLIISIAGSYVLNNSSIEQIKHTYELIGVVMSFIQYFILIIMGLTFIGVSIFLYSRSTICIKRINELLKNKSTISDNGKNQTVDNGSIEFKNVCYKYDKNSIVNVIDNLSFKINSGDNIGIIGSTGSGKTTLCDLILRLYDADNGQILISDHDIKDISISNLHDNISIAFQDKILLNKTIKENLLVANKQATDEEIIQALKDAQAYEFVINKKEGLNYLVDQRAKNLSGGEKQRISIARALLKKDHKILIFDDSTSALDNITERKLLEALNNRYKDKTLIIVSQKVRSIRNCDKILVIDDGKIIEQGTHVELLKLNGLYKELHESQSIE